MNWYDVILTVAFVAICIYLGTQKGRILKPVNDDYNDLLVFLGIKEGSNGQLEVVSSQKPFRGLKETQEHRVLINTLFKTLGIEYNAANLDVDPKVVKDGYISLIKSYVDYLFNIASLLGVAWDKDGVMVYSKDGKVIDLGQSPTMIEQINQALKKALEIKDSLDNKVDTTTFNSVQETIASNQTTIVSLSSLVDFLKDRIEYIRQKAGYFENWERFTLDLSISEEQAKTLTKVYNTLEDIKKDLNENEAKFLKSCGLDIVTASAIVDKIRGPKEEDSVAP